MNLLKKPTTYFSATLITTLFAAVLVAQAPVLAVNVTSDTQPLNAQTRETLKNLTKEADRRITTLEERNEDVSESTILPDDAKKTLTNYNTGVIDSVKDIKASAQKAKTTDAVKDLAGKINSQYGSFKNANATSALTVNLDAQGDVQKKIATAARDIQAIINDAGAKATNLTGGSSDTKDGSEALGGSGSSIKLGSDGMTIVGGGGDWQEGLMGSFGGGGGGGEGGGQQFELANVQEMLDQLLSLAASAAAIIAAVITLIEALVSGDFAGAAQIFATILSQLLGVEDLQLDSLAGLIGLSVSLTGSFGVGN